MRKLASLLLACGALWAQDPPPACGAARAPGGAGRAAGAANTGKPMVVPFRCTEEDIRSAGLTCSEQDPCPVYLELAAVESTGIRIFTAGNIHTANATLFTILLGTEDNGQTWREVHERVRGAGLDHLQFADVETGWTSGLSFAPLPQDPFLLMTTDGGKTWRSHAIFNETRFGSIQQFFFEDKKSGSLVIDHGAGSGERPLRTVRDQRRRRNLEYPRNQRQGNPHQARPADAESRLARARRRRHQELPSGAPPGTEMDFAGRLHGESGSL